MKKYNSKLLIVGSGPAGYTAAIYAARANLEPILVTGLQPGGQLTITTDVENYPGFAKPIQGPFLMEQMREQAIHCGTTVLDDHIESIDLSSNLFMAKGYSGEYQSNSVILAMGAQAKWLGLDSEAKFRGYGVSGCATCDGFFFKNKIVAVVGGGNVAVEEAIYLTNHASKVYLVHRRDKLRAEMALQKRLFSNNKIEILWNSEIEEIFGTEKPFKEVHSVKLKSTTSNTSQDIKVDGVFVAIGHSPNSQLVANQITLDAEGYIVTSPNSTKTNVPGVFAAGDIQDKIYRQAVTAAGTGCMAAIEASKYLEEAHQ